jgi:DNA (cytosine-5)-methyltransferase 1
MRMRIVKAMGPGMIERYGDRPGRTRDQPAFTIRASAGGREPGGFRFQTDEPPALIKMTIEEAGALQSYPPDFVWHGSKTSQFLQVGNAVPPPLAEAVLQALWAL